MNHLTQRSHKKETRHDPANPSNLDYLGVMTDRLAAPDRRQAQGVNSVTDHATRMRNDNQKEMTMKNMTEQMAGAGTGTGPTSVPCPAHPISPCGCDERTGAQPAADAGSGGKLERRLAK